MKMRFLETFTMITLRIAQAKQSFLQERILLIPEGKGDMLVAMSITYTSDTILAPSERSRPCLVVREVAPSVAVVRVVFPYSGPLSLSSIAAPFLPILCPFPVLLQPLLFFAEVLMVVDHNHH